MSFNNDINLMKICPYAELVTRYLFFSYLEYMLYSMTSEYVKDIKENKKSWNEAY